MSGIRIGQVTHFYRQISVAVLALTDTLRVGDTVHFMGSTTDFRQEIASMEIEHQPVEEAGPGQEVALKVQQRVRARDKIFKLTGEE